jgi:hypothetical protein
VWFSAAFISANDGSRSTNEPSAVVGAVGAAGGVADGDGAAVGDGDVVGAAVGGGVLGAASAGCGAPTRQAPTSAAAVSAPANVEMVVRK